jgi:HPt (histidine-containing phosphotransfer) domain-containing protein
MTQAIDLQHLEQYVGDDAGLRDEILSIFEDQVEGWLARLDPSADDQDWKNAAHALKGASRGVGAFELGDLCETAEGLIGSAQAGPARAALLAQIKKAAESAMQCARVLRG